MHRLMNFHKVNILSNYLTDQERALTSAPKGLSHSHSQLRCHRGIYYFYFHHHRLVLPVFEFYVKNFRAYTFHVWFLLNILFVRFIHTASLRSSAHFHCYVAFQYVNIYQFIYPMFILMRIWIIPSFFSIMVLHIVLL